MGARSVDPACRAIAAGWRPMLAAVVASLALTHPLAAATGWVLQTSPSTNNLFDIQALDANTAIAVGANGTILRTTNGGNTWVALTSGTTQSLNAVHFQDANNGWAVGGTILKTTDGGNNWTVQNAGASGTTLQDVRFLTPRV